MNSVGVIFFIQTFICHGMHKVFRKELSITKIWSPHTHTHTHTHTHIYIYIYIYIYILFLLCGDQSSPRLWMKNWQTTPANNCNGLLSGYIAMQKVEEGKQFINI